MSHHGSANRGHASRRDESYERIGLSRRHSVERAEAHVEFENSPDLQPPPRIYIRAPTGFKRPPPRPARTISHEKAAGHPSREDYHGSRRSRYSSGNYADIKREDSHEHTSFPMHDDGGRMPTIQQNYRPSYPRPEYTTFTQMPGVQSTAAHSNPLPAYLRRRDRSRRKNDETKFLHGSGGGDGGDIQTSAVDAAEPDADTLNKIMICVYRNSKRQFVQKEVWMMKPGHRTDIFLETSESLRNSSTFRKSLRTDEAFFEEIKGRYKTQLRGTFRQYLSFKTVSTVRVLGVRSHSS